MDSKVVFLIIFLVKGKKQATQNLHAKFLVLAQVSIGEVNQFAVNFRFFFSKLLDQCFENIMLSGPRKDKDYVNSWKENSPKPDNLTNTHHT